MQPRMLVAETLPHFALARLRERFELIEGTVEDASRIEPAILLCSIGQRLDRHSIERLPPSVRAIATYSVGIDHIDIEAARARDIAVFNTAGILGDAVADAALLLILGVARRVTESSALIRGGNWQGWNPTQLNGQGLSGRRLGILGMGDIGRRIAQRAAAFGMIVTYHNRKPVDADVGAHWLPVDELLSAADIIVLAWPSTDATRRFIGREALSLVKPSAILVNIGRGDLVDDDALIDALEKGRLWGAGLDVFDGEPRLDPRYLTLPNVFPLPHIGSSTCEAREAMAAILAEAIESWLTGGNPANRIA